MVSARERGGGCCYRQMCILSLNCLQMSCEILTILEIRIAHTEVDDHEKTRMQLWGRRLEISLPMYIQKPLERL